ncbi:hypothetical protein JW968_04765 [Candidatus Woesearchaeota archaeon]|nr:hypothetical protein [Candidatus Woesearchaeota archaeon]
MSRLISKHAPTLRTIKMVEKTMEEMDSIFSIADLKKRLPKQVNHNTLIEILEYLEESRKIHVCVKGITWIYNDSPKMKEALRKAKRHI